MANGPNKHQDHEAPIEDRVLNNTKPTNGFRTLLPHGPPIQAQKDPKGPDSLFLNPQASNITNIPTPMKIKKREVSQCRTLSRHLDLDNDEPKVPTAGNLSISHSDLIGTVQSLAKALNIGGVLEGETSQLLPIYPEENMLDSP
ncbi:hypothetical protein FXO37_08598 [Capsicum annuum]|nr:hypothetical protein FXO37_08598 [Capsicum annuum]